MQFFPGKSQSPSNGLSRFRIIIVQALRNNSLDEVLLVQYGHKDESHGWSIS